MPAADNGVNYWVSNVAQPALKSPTSETVLYPASAQQAGGFTTIDAAPIADAVKALGYAANADAKGAYNRQVGVNAPTLVNADGSAHQASADNTAPWVGLRQVISGNDVTIPVGTGFDPVANPDMALKVFDQNGALVDLFDKSLVTFSPETINTTTPGTHQMTVGYTPDGVTRTFTITVAPKDVITVKPEPPHLRDGRWVVIPEMEGVEYQVDGETVTGEIHLTTLGELVEVTAVAKPGYQLDPTTGPTWGFTWGLPATPEKPTQSGNTVTIPDTTGVDYQVDGKTVTGELTLTKDITVTAVPKSDYYFTEDPPSWDFTFQASDKVVTATAPTQKDNVVTIPTVNGVDYLVDDKVVTEPITLTDGQKVTVTARAQEGFVLDATTTPTWTFEYKDSGDQTTTVTPKAPTQGADEVTIPTVTGVDYLVDGKVVTGTLTIPDGTTIVVTARAQDGYVITEGATTRWTFTYNKDVPPVCDTQYFTDVTPNMQFFNDICWLKESGITTGWPDGTYRPVTPINRDAMIAYIYRMAGSPAFTPTKQTFSDVAPSTMYYREIEWAAHEGITTGWPDGTFRPVTPVARDAMAAFLYRQSGSPAVTLPASPSFSDVPAGNMYYREIEWMQHEGIANGWLDGTFRPLNDTNRDAMAAFLHRAVESGVLTLA